MPRIREEGVARVSRWRQALYAALGATLRLLPPGLRGKARLARALIRSGPGEILVSGRYGSRFWVPSLSEPVGFHLFTDGVYEPDEVGWVLGQLEPGDTFVDVGANIGAFAIPAARKVGPSGRVIAIEPSPSVFEYLARNVALNGLSNVDLFPVVADATSAAAVTFYRAPVSRFGGGALTPEYGGTPVLRPACSLDEVLDAAGVSRVKVLKIDVEGFEGRVLRGARSLLLGADAPRVLFEFHDWAEANAGTPGDAQRLLLELGFRLWRFPVLYRGGPSLSEPLTVGGGNLVAVAAADS